MANYRSFRDRRDRLPTFAERVQRADLDERGVADVHVPLGEAPAEFWIALLQAVHWQVCSEDALGGDPGVTWWQELRWQHGWPEKERPELASLFRGIVLRGSLPFSTSKLSTEYRIAAMRYRQELWIGAPG